MGAVLRQMSRSKGAGLMLGHSSSRCAPLFCLESVRVEQCRHCPSNSRGGALCASSANSAIAPKKQGRVP